MITAHYKDATIQKPSAGYSASAAAANAAFIQSDASVMNTYTVRLSNASLGYSISKGLLGVDDARIYLQGQNLLLLSNYKGIDPEFSLAGYTSPMTVLSMGVNLKF